MSQYKTGLWLVDRWGGKIAFLGPTGWRESIRGNYVYSESGRPYRFPFHERTIQLLDEDSHPKSNRILKLSRG